jgi:hypothetical protein
METLKKRTLFWDTAQPDPRRNERFIIERILNHGDVEDFRWAVRQYGLGKIKKNVQEGRVFDAKSESFWRQYFKIKKIKCSPKQLQAKQSAFSKR